MDNQLKRPNLGNPNSMNFYKTSGLDARNQLLQDGSISTQDKLNSWMSGYQSSPMNNRLTQSALNSLSAQQQSKGIYNNDLSNEQLARQAQNLSMEDIQQYINNLQNIDANRLSNLSNLDSSGLDYWKSKETFDLQKQALEQSKPKGFWRQLGESLVGGAISSFAGIPINMGVQAGEQKAANYLANNNIYTPEYARGQTNKFQGALNSAASSMSTNDLIEVIRRNPNILQSNKKTTVGQ
ncbi:hypothetical protein EBS40_09185 [bacterium]|nr:hypothetical protein [bacterium]